MKKKIQNTKLKLDTEIIKTLDDKQLAQAVGAGMNPTYSCWKAACTTP